MISGIDKDTYFPFFVAAKAVEKQKRRTELVKRFIERIIQEAPNVGENVKREMRTELEELAEQCLGKQVFFTISLINLN